MTSNMISNSNPIGIFDSGIGGLTVFKEIRRILPHEDLIYFGDTARVPYGSKSKETILKYSIEICRFLIQKSVKAIVVACNTSSSLALEELQEIFDIPIFGVIGPGARRAVAEAMKTMKTASQNSISGNIHSTISGSIAVIGTQATMKSKAYSKAIANAITENSLINLKKKYTSDSNLYLFPRNSINNITVIEKPCPLFVPIVEEGIGCAGGDPLGGDIVRRTVKYYLNPIVKHNPSCLVLGCTHYPIIKDIIASEIGGGITIIDSGVETASFVLQYLKNENMLKVYDTKHNKHTKNTENAKGAHNVLNIGSSIAGEDKFGESKFFVSDDPEKFKEIGEKFLGESIGDIELVEEF